jgi:hemerythrin
MSPLQWRGDFDTGIREMDVEHRRLIAHIMELQQELAGNADTSRLLKVLSRIYAEIAEHFSLEERVMQQMRYKAYADHKEDHDTLLDDLREIMDMVREDGVLDEAGLTDDLDRWFSDHFRLHDAKFYDSENS